VHDGAAGLRSPKSITRTRPAMGMTCRVWFSSDLGLAELESARRAVRWTAPNAGANACVNSGDLDATSMEGPATWACCGWACSAWSGRPCPARRG